MNADKTNHLLRERNLAAVGLIFAYLAINSLFIAKYGTRITAFWPWVIPVFFLFVILFFLALKAFDKFISSRFDLFFFGLAVSGVVLYFILLLVVDPETLNINRYSAVTTFNSKLIASKFPYGPEPTQNGNISGLPFSHLLQLPFYLIGEIGLYQVLIISCFIVGLRLYYGRSLTGILAVGLLIGSPAVAYEVACRSDVFSNLALIVLYIFALDRFNPFTKTGPAVISGVIGGLLLSTRIVVLLPLAVYLVGRLRNGNRPKIAMGVGASVITAAVLVIPFYLWDTAAFIEYNPITTQSSYLPLYARIIVSLSAIPIGFLFGKGRVKYPAIAYLLFLTVSLSLFFCLCQYGLNSAFFGNLFDITYFSMVLPFIFFGLKRFPTMSTVPVNEIRTEKG